MTVILAWHERPTAGEGVPDVVERRCAMTTSNPNVPQPAGGADPEGEDHDETVDPLLQDSLEGAVPDHETGDGPPPESAHETDSVEADRERADGD
jgi:hypothetical protein